MTIRLRDFQPTRLTAHIAQSVEHTLGKGEVTGPNPVVGSVAESSVSVKRRKRHGEAEI